VWKYQNQTAMIEQMHKKRPDEKKVETVGGELFHFEHLIFMRVFNAGLRVSDEKPDLMWSLLQEWLNSDDEGLSTV